MQCAHANRLWTVSSQDCAFEVSLQAHLSIIGSDLGLELPRKLDTAHPLRDACHLLSEHLCVLHLLARPLHHHHPSPTTESTTQQVNNTEL